MVELSSRKDSRLHEGDLKKCTEFGVAYLMEAKGVSWLIFPVF
jgi:hypothetical protein